MSTPRVTIAGGSGSYAEEAAVRLLGEGVQLVRCATFADVVLLLRSGGAEHGVLPVENAIIGTVRPAAELVEQAALPVVATVTIPIHHHLVGCAGATVSGLRRVESHPAALAQCSGFLARHPHIIAESSADTGTSVRRVVESGDPSRAAIGSLRAARLHGATVLSADVQDRSDNHTHFVLLAAASVASTATNRSPAHAA